LVVASLGPAVITAPAEPAEAIRAVAVSADAERSTDARRLTDMVVLIVVCPLGNTAGVDRRNPAVIRFLL
jgi:hypothetical protein